MEAIGEAIFDIPFMISFHAKSLSKIMGAVLRAGTDMEKFFQPIYVLEFIKWNRRDGPITNGGIRERGVSVPALKNGSHNFVHTFSMTLYYE